MAVVERWFNSLPPSTSSRPFGPQYEVDSVGTQATSKVSLEHQQDFNDGIDSDQSFTAGWSASEPADPLWWQKAVFYNSLDRLVDVSAQLEAARRELVTS